MAFPISRKRIFVTLSACAALLVFPRLSAATAQQPASSKPLDTRAESWTDLSHKERMAAQESQSLVADQLAERFGDHPGYGLRRFEKDFTTLTPYWAGEVPAELEQFVNESPAGITINVETAPYTIAELNAEASRLIDEEKQAAIPLTGVNVPTKMTHLEVYVEPGTGSNRAANLEAGIPLTYTEQEGSVSAAGRQDANSPFRGGAVIKSFSPSFVFWCSTGVTVVQGGVRRMLTAEHCQTTEGRSVWTRPEGEEQHVGLSGHGDKELDAMVIRSEEYDTRVFAGPWDSTHWEFVHGRRNPWQDEQIAGMGGFTGTRWGQVLNPHQFQHLDDLGYTIGPGLVVGSGTVHRGVAGDGDSGSPAVRHRDDGRLSLRGILAALRKGWEAPCEGLQNLPGGRNRVCAQRVFYIQIMPIENRLNLRVLSEADT